MSLSLAELLSFLDERQITHSCSGAQGAVVESFSALPVERNQVLCWARDAASLETARIEEHAQVVVFVPSELAGITSPANTYIAVDKPRASYFETLQRFFVEEPKPGIDPSAVIETTEIGASVVIGAHCYIGPKVAVADKVRIGHGVIIDCPATIGTGTIIHSGVVIGTDGFGFYKQADGSAGKIPHLGGVIIGEDVEIGANTCVDRGTLADTVIEDGVKIDNLCHIAHNVRIGANSLVIAQSLIGGSTVIGEEGYVAPGAVIANKLHIGRHALIGMGAVVTKDVPADTVVAGVPAKVIRRNDQDLF